MTLGGQEGRNRTLRVISMASLRWFQVSLSCSVAPFFPFSLVAAPLKWSSQERVPFFSRVTEQLSSKLERQPLVPLGASGLFFLGLDASNRSNDSGFRIDGPFKKQEVHSVSDPSVLRAGCPFSPWAS